MSTTSDSACQVCGKLEPIMKRCTRCRGVIYCSRQCQLRDWGTHKNVCKKHREVKQPRTTDKNCIWKEDDETILTDENTDSTRNIRYHPLADFDKALRKGKETPTAPETETSGLAASRQYLNNDIIMTDVPLLAAGQPFDVVTVKGNKDKRSIDVQCSWSGEDVMKVIACEVKIPLNKLKVIHKGKVMTSDNIRSVIKSKAVFQVIGQQAADEEGIDKRDIEAMMKQLGIERNVAIEALRKTGDVIDAILEVGSK